MSEFEQILTDGAMAFLTGLTLAIMIALMLLSIVRREFVAALWSFTFILPYSWIALGYYFLWLNPDTPTALFPIVAVLHRPGIVGISAAVVLYSIYRSSQRRNAKKR